MGVAPVPDGATKVIGTIPVTNFAQARNVPRNPMKTSIEGMQFELSFDVPAGSYDVELAFAETNSSSCETGARVFNVHINELIQLESFDIFNTTGGCGRAVLQKFEEQVDAVIKKPLTIRFDAVAGKASVSYIRIRTSPKQCIPEIGDPDLKQGVDHVAHAVPGKYPPNGEYYVDNAGLGFRDVAIDGRRSHSHMFDAVTGQSGTVKSYLWTDADSGEILARTAQFKLRAKVGATRLRLRVVDTGCSMDEAETTITVTGKIQQGAYCYYYGPQDELLAVETLTDETVRPTFSKATGSLDLGFPEFPGSDGLFSARCIFSVSTDENEETPLLLDTFDTGEATLYKGPDLVVDTRTATNGSTPTSDGLTPFELVYRRLEADKPARLRLKIAGAVVSGPKLSYDQSLVLPIVTKISPTSLPETGGARVRITGHGMFEPVTVRFDNEVAKVNLEDSTPELLFVRAPPGSGAVKVTVSSGADLVSNAKTLRYGSGCPDAIGFAQKRMEKTSGHIVEPTAAELWQDGKLYVGNRRGYVTAVDYDVDTLTVTSSCRSETLIDPRFTRANGAPSVGNILGLTFDPRDTAPRPYVSFSILFWAGRRAAIDPSNPRRWSNGAVIRLKPASSADLAKDPSRCLVKDKTIVRNLPVSGTDHGVNDLLFTQDGDLLIGVGGMTNAGFPDYKLSGTWEAQLSGAILVAHLSRPSFDGDIDYDDKDNIRLATPKSSDVETYAVGTRNPFRLAMRRNGEMYVLDNGPNCRYGNATYSCSEYDEAEAAARDINSRDPFESQVDTYSGGRCKEGDFGVPGPDKLLRLEKGAFYGHPNLQRGGDECAWINPYSNKAPPPKNTAPPKRYRAAVSTFGPAATGLLEYGSQHFCGALRGELIVAKYKGRLTQRVKIGQKANPKPERLFSYGGLRNIENEFGDIIFPKLSGVTLVARPKTTDDGALFVANAVPFRFGRGGGGSLRIGGRGFDTGEEVGVSVGGNPCDVQSVSSKLIVCTVPAGKAGSQADVIVTVGADEAVLPKAILYMEV